jgi:hypothetical protein
MRELLRSKDNWKYLPLATRDITHVNRSAEKSARKPLVQFELAAPSYRSGNGAAPCG